MREVGIDISRHHSKSLKGFTGEAFDYVITVCDNARDACPAFPGATNQLHWGFDDPAHASGTDDEKRRVFRRVRDEIEHRIRQSLSARKE